MPIDPKDFMLYWAGGTALVIVLLFRRPRRRGMRLRLLGGRTVKSSAPVTMATTYPPPRRAAARERSLNVVFNYNGHSWDAHEVLGVPAGSSADAVRAAFAESMKTVDPTSRPFIEAAYRAITQAFDRAG